jgi:hypothetical protein
MKPTAKSTVSPSSPQDTPSSLRKLNRFTGRQTRWVEPKDLKTYDASSVPSEWHGWLHNTTNQNGYVVVRISFIDSLTQLSHTPITAISEFLFDFTTSSNRIHFIHFTHLSHSNSQTLY